MHDIQKKILPNGLAILTESMPHVRSVAVGIWLGSGSRQEQPERNGISHFIEHMVFKGTKTRTAEQIARSMDSIGGHMDAFTAKECVSFNAVVLDEHLETAFDVLSDLVLYPLFQNEDIRRERSVILEEIKAEEDNPDYLLQEIFTQNFWEGHALGKPILGTRETIGLLERNTLQDEFEQIYRPNNIVISAAGHLEHDRLANMAEQRFSALKKQEMQLTDPKPATHSRITLHDKQSLEQVHLCLGVPSYPMSHDGRFACHVLNTLLGGGMSSRLFQNIREKQGLAYAVFSEMVSYKDTGCLFAYAATSPETASQVVNSIIQEFRELKEKAVDPEELRRAKDHLKGSLMLSLESTGSRMSNLARQHMNFGRFFTLDEVIAKIEAVTAEDLREIARKFFRTDDIALTVLGRLDGLKIGREMLAC